MATRIHDFYLRKTSEVADFESFNPDFPQLHVILHIPK
jgi:hypothetical protein